MDHGQPLSVLLVENNPADAELSLRELRKAGLEVCGEVVETAEEFRRHLGAKAYDIVLSDYGLSGWNGMEALETLRQETQDVPFILVTGALGDEGAVDCIRRGASDYVLKDQLGRLPVAVMRALQEKRLRKERSRGEAFLRDRERRFRALIENSIDGIALLSSDATFHYCSPVTQTILGYSAEELLGSNIFDSVHPDDRETFQRVFRRLVTGPGVRLRAEFRYHHKDGSWRWIEAVGANFLADPSIQGIVANYRGITERKQAEEEIRRLNEELEQRVIERTAQIEAANRKLQIEIGERERAEAERGRLLRQAESAEARFRVVLESAPDGMVISNSDGYIVLVNRRTEEIFGYKRDELLGRPADVMVPERFREVYAAYRASFHRMPGTHQKRAALELYARRKDGSEFPVEVTLSLTEPEGKVLVTSVIRDVSGRKRAEEALKMQARLLESMAEGVSLLDEGGGILYTNPAEDAMFGYESGELLGKHVSVLKDYPSDQSQRFVRDTIGQLKNQGTWVGEVRSRKKDGAAFLTFCRISALEMSGKWCWVCVETDITERRRSEEAMERLRRQNELILAAAGEGICGLGRDGSTSFVNPPAAKMLGWEARELIGSSMHEVAHHSKPNGAPYPPEECPITLTLKDGTIRNVNNEVFWRKDGTSFPVEYTTTPIQEGGEIVGAVLTFKDITERRAVERMKDEFVSLVGHELRTPLTSIRGALGLVASGRLGELQGKSQRMLEIAVANTDRLVRLINDILDIERIESGSVSMAKQHCDTADLMVQAAEVMQPMAQRAGVRLVVNPQSELLWADPDRIIQTLTNLISNAIKFSRPNKPVWLTVERREKEILFRVQDQGRGIPADKLESIFGRFCQVDASDSREKGGTGLGLSICRTIAQQHGGRLWAESRLGEGSTFFLALPAEVETKAEAPPPSSLVVGR